MNIVVADVRNYLHRLMDDDFTVNSNSNDEKAERMSESRSKRVYWKTFLPLRLQFAREEFEVAIISVQLKNVQVNSPSSWICDGGGDDVTSRSIPPQRIETFADLFPYLIPMVAPQEPEMKLWLVMHEALVGDDFVYRDMSTTLKSAYENFRTDPSRVLNDITKQLTDSLPTSTQFNVPSKTLPGSSMSELMEYLAEQGFGSVLSSSTTYNVNWKGHADRRFGNDFYSVESFAPGLLMSEDAAKFLRVNSKSAFRSCYIVDGVMRDAIFGNKTNRNDGKKYYYIALIVGNYQLRLEHSAGIARKPVIERSWDSILPLRLSFEAGGTSDPNTSKKLILRVAPGKTLKFTALDPKTNQEGFYTYKKGIIFEGTPAAFYEFLTTRIVGLYDFLTPDVGSVNISVEGLRYRTGPYTSSNREDNHLLVTNLALTDSLVHYTPPPRARMYRVLENTNTENLTVDIVDSLNPQRSPRFHVGITDVTLHFRELWNNPFRPI